MTKHLLPPPPPVLGGVWNSNCWLCSASHWKLHSLNLRYPLRHQTCRTFYIGTNFLSIPIKSNCKNPGDVMIRTWMKKKEVFTTIVDFLWSKSADEAKSWVNQNKKMLWEQRCCHWLITNHVVSASRESSLFFSGICPVIQNGPGEFTSPHHCSNHLGHILSKGNRAKWHFYKHFKATSLEQCATSCRGGMLLLVSDGTTYRTHTTTP